VLQVLQVLLHVLWVLPALLLFAVVLFQPVLLAIVAVVAVGALLQLVVAVLEAVVLPVVFLLNCHVSFQAVLFLLVSKLACFGL